MRLQDQIHDLYKKCEEQDQEIKDLQEVVEILVSHCKELDAEEVEEVYVERPTETAVD